MPRVSGDQVEEWPGADCEAGLQIPVLDHCTRRLLHDDESGVCGRSLGIDLPGLQFALSQVKVSGGEKE